MKIIKSTLRDWLLENDYEDVADIINEIMIEWSENGNKQRRNWWAILAGDNKGQSRTIAGRKLPVLKAAQIRMGVKVTANALCRNEKEMPLPIKKNRWNKKNKNRFFN